MPNIKPSLFIGVGTTGAEILGQLQELIVQEYMIEEFPVTRLLCFVTEEADGRFLRHANRGQVMYITVPSTQVVRNEVKKAATKASKALGAWLAEETCKNVQRFEHGSNSMRMAGRLQLWHNYEKIRKKIEENIRACTTIEAKKAAADHLASHLGIDVTRVDEVVEAGLNIYIVGSLCGGTCSGMFLDLGYILRSLPQVAAFRGEHHVQVFGVFSILNNAQAKTPDWELQAANCHAALSELDYCYHKGAESLPIVSPDGEERQRDEYPYNYIYLMGPTSLEGESLVDRDNNFSHKAVLQMISHSLFLDSYAGTYAIKEGIRTDFAAKIILGDPDSKKRKPRALFSFGCSMVTYPMYSIARASAALIGQKICTEWLSKSGKVGDFHKIVQETRKRFLNEIFPRITQPEGMPSLQEELMSDIRKAKELTKLDAENLRIRIRELPSSEDAISERFYVNGHYYDILENQLRSVVEPLSREVVRDFIEKCRVDLGCNLTDALVGVRRLREMLNAENGKLAQMASGEIFPISKMDPIFNKLHSLESDFWLKIMGLRRSALKERKLQVRNIFAKLAKRALDTLSCRFLQEAITGALEELDEIEEYLTLEGRTLRELADPDNQGEGYFATQAKNIKDNLRNPPRNVRYLLSAPDGTVESELELQQRKISTKEADLAMVGSVYDGNKRFSLKWTKRLIDLGKSDEIGAGMLDALTISILRKMKNAGTRVLDESLKRWDSLADVINYASPYMEFTQDYLQGKGNRLRPPTPTSGGAVFGDATTDIALGNRLKGKVNPLQNQNGAWGYRALPGLTHYLIFYQEEAYFSTTFMAASEAYEKAYRNHRDSSIASSQILRWTDKRWYPKGPPFGDLDRAQYIRFLLEHALEVLRGTRVSGDEAVGDIADRLFRWLVEDQRRIYYFELPSRRGIPERVYVGRESDYKQKANSEIARKFIPYLVEKLSSVVRTLGETPAKSLEKFKDRYMSVKRGLDLEREDGLASESWSESQSKIYEEKIAKLDAFYVHIRCLTWDESPTSEELELLRNFPWLTNWAQEEY